VPSKNGKELRGAARAVEGGEESDHTGGTHSTCKYALEGITPTIREEGRGTLTKREEGEEGGKGKSTTSNTCFEPKGENQAPVIGRKKIPRKVHPEWNDRKTRAAQNGKKGMTIQRGWKERESWKH